MNKTLLIFLKLIVFLILVLSLYTTSYFCLEILPLKKNIDEKITAYKNQNSNINTMEKMAIQEEGSDGVSRFVSHSLVLEYRGNSHLRNFWHLLGLHWYLWIPLIYDNKKIFSIWLAIAPYGDGRGMNEAAAKYFGLPISELDCNQMAELVVMVRSPSYFVPGGQHSKNRIESSHLIDVCH